MEYSYFEFDILVLFHRWKQQQKYMQGKRQAIIHRKVISNDEIEKTAHFSLSKQPSRQADRFKNVKVSKMGRPKKHSLSVNSEKIGDGLHKFEMINEEERKRFNAKTRNLFNFFPTYTQLVDNQMKEYFFNNTITFTHENQQLKHYSVIKPEEKIANDRKKLAPIRKNKSSQGGDNRKNSRVSFLNVEKIELQQVGDSSEREKMTLTVSQVARRGMVISQNYYESAIMNYETPEIPEMKIRSSYRDQATPIIRIKPFVPPFQRFHYFDFIWKVAFSNGIKIQFQEALPKKYKIFIGHGNNSMLIKTLFKRRESWWSITPNIDEANFVWTQIKIGSVFASQSSNKPAEWVRQEFMVPEKKTPAYRRNIKIMNGLDTENWIKYFQKNKELEQKMVPSFNRRCKCFKKIDEKTLNLDKVKVHNHLQRNYVLGNKKALFSTMKKYYEGSKKDVFEYLPLTFHIQNGVEDPEYYKFLQYFYKKAKEIKTQENTNKNKTRNIWIVKPGEFTNRGNGITVCQTLDEVKAIVKNRKKLESGGMRTYIVQEYLDRPFLYCRRKFDIRHYMLITMVNGHIKGYWYEVGYIRTTSYEYSVKNSFSSVHLTNDAVQKMLPDYGRYEKGNKISYEDFEKYLENQYGKRYSFYSQIYPKMKQLARDSMRASAGLLDEQRKGHNFEIFGFDFMIDSNFKPWLIEINTNPCLELNCPILIDLIPNMLQNAVKIGVDSVLPPPHTFTEKRARFNTNILEENKFELLFDSTLEEEELEEIASSAGEVKLNFKELEKDQEEVYEDDGVELDD